MNTLQLDGKISAPGFLGAHAYNELPPRKAGDHSFIINTSPSSEPGDHWLVLVIKNGVFYFIDSYGRGVDDFTFSPDFRQFIKKYIGSEKIIHNDRWVQSLTSNVCGDYCIYFIEEIYRIGFRKMMSVFSTRFMDNDMLVLNYVKNI